MIYVYINVLRGTFDIHIYLNLSVFYIYTYMQYNTPEWYYGSTSSMVWTEQQGYYTSVV